MHPQENFEIWNVGDAISRAFRVNLRQKRGFDRTHRTSPRSAMGVMWQIPILIDAPTPISRPLHSNVVLIPMIDIIMQHLLKCDDPKR